MNCFDKENPEVLTFSVVNSVPFTIDDGKLVLSGKYHSDMIMAIVYYP